MRCVLPSLALPFVCMAACTHPVTAVSAESCVGYPEWTTSPYVLPYAVGTEHEVIQGNCAPPGDGHTGVTRYAYDWETPIGTPIVAVRGGRVVDVESSHRDGEIADTGKDNYVVILHADGSTALYGHLTQNGAAVTVGDIVAQGSRIGLTGNTGNTANIPHLHLSVQSCDPVTRGTANCPTTALTFRNTQPNPQGLNVGQRYRAE